MLKIEAQPWAVMVEHGRACFPRECCGILVGSAGDAGDNVVTLAIACTNAYEGDQKDRFELDPRDVIKAERAAREQRQGVVGFFHSHPNEDAYFSATDLKFSAPGYSNVVMSIRDGEFSHAKCFIANFDQTAAEPEELHYA
ncbi:MAG: M67 family metallopeptidase [Acidobacteria bacterium]|nr:M67 family metallopeptidase [Acidobacteriota bacterium]